MTEATPKRMDDMNVSVAGQGGDGSLTVISILSELLARRGYHLFQARDVASRIKGGHAAAMMRGSLTRRGCMGDHIDLLLAFDQEAVDIAAADLAPDGIVIYDASDGPVSRDDLPASVTVFEVPFGRFAVRDLRRDLFKNSLSFGILSRIMGLEEDEAETCLRHTFKRLPERLVEANLKAFNSGRAYALEIGLSETEGLWAIERAERHEQLLITGNEATAFGFLVAGGRFFAGYPITPATEIFEWLLKNIDQFGGIALQAEDELAAVNMSLSAAMTGTRSMTATSGPGYALMQEGISQAGSAEIPLVVVNCQRAGPSTGMPTKSEQSDINMMVFGASGDYPRIVLSPGGPRDCFELSYQATELSQRLQTPVIIAMDQALGQDARTVDAFDLDHLALQKSAKLDADDVADMAEYRRYKVTPNGVSPWSLPGTLGGESLVTGNERNEWGLVSGDPENRRQMIDKRQRKVDQVRAELPKGRLWGEADAEIGLLGIGMQLGVMREASERLIAAGLKVKCLQPRTLWPVVDETIEFVESSRTTYVIEHNESGQLARLLTGEGLAAERIRSVLKYDGVPFRPGELVDEIAQFELAGQSRAQPELVESGQ